jgi:hypothetical protein
MFWFSTIRDLRRRVKDLEEAKKAKDIKENCAAGNHPWIMINADKKIPFVRCPHCYATPKENP